MLNGLAVADVSVDKHHYRRSKVQPGEAALSLLAGIANRMVAARTKRRQTSAGSGNKRLWRFKH